MISSKIFIGMISSKTFAVMISSKTFAVIFLSVMSVFTSCQTAVKEEDKIFHAGPVNSGFGGIFFALYKDNKYQFCDGDFMDPGCYTGEYSLAGDTITLYHLKSHTGIPSNRFVIRRYQDMDSSYWQWKYPDHKDDWEIMQDRDTRASAGDIFPLNLKGEIVFDRNNYFLIRLDKLKNIPVSR
jgi:hypothetical protein